MPNENRILDRIIKNNDMELMPNELEQMLDAELAKPEDEVNTQLVSDLIDLLDIDTPSEVEKRSDWKNIVRKHKKSQIIPKILRRTVIAAASVVVVFIVTFTSAKAFDWTFLLKYLLPVAQTFGIVSSDYLIDDGQVTEYGFDDDMETQSIDFYSLDDLPSDFAASIVESNCIPNGYQFIQGSWFKAMDLEKCSFIYSKAPQNENAEADHWFTIEISDIPMNDGMSVTDIEYERQLRVPQTVVIEGIDVTLYYNSDEMGINVSWLLGNTHYNVFGSISEDELSYIISGLKAYHQY